MVGVKVRRLTKGGKITTGSKYRDIPHNTQGNLQLSLALQQRCSVGDDGIIATSINFSSTLIPDDQDQFGR